MENGFVEMCACGKELHYELPYLKEIVQRVVNENGPDIRVTINGRSWMVPRHFIALHGLTYETILAMGFPEVTA